MNGSLFSPPSAGSTPAPASAPGAAAQPGLDAQAMIKVRQATLLLADAVSVLKTKLNSDLAKGVISALKTLAPLTPGVQEGLGQSELASLIGGLSPVRQAPPPSNFMGLRRPQPQTMAMAGPQPAPGPMAGRPGTSGA